MKIIFPNPKNLDRQERRLTLRQAIQALAALALDDAKKREENIVSEKWDKFTKFQELPTELRLKIWKFAIGSFGNSRVHKVACLFKNWRVVYSNSSDNLSLKAPLRISWEGIEFYEIEGEGDDDYTYVQPAFVSNQPISPILHVSSEARESYLEATKQVFVYGTYANLQTDTMYLHNVPADAWPYFRSFITSRGTSHVEKIAFDSDLCFKMGYNPHPFVAGQPPAWFPHKDMYKWLQTQLPKLKELMLVNFDNGRGTPESTWEELDLELVEFSSRNKRRFFEVNFLRSKYIKRINHDLEAEEGGKAINFRVVSTMKWKQAKRTPTRSIRWV